MLNRFIAWIKEHLQRVVRQESTPHCIALGFSIGIFLGFSPLFGLKTLLALGVAWVLRCNKVAAAVGVTLHDVALPLIPILFKYELRLGRWILQQEHISIITPHHGMHLNEWLNWTTFLHVGQPLLLGSIVVGAPVALLSYFIMRAAVARYQAIKVTPP